MPDVTPAPAPEPSDVGADLSANWDAQEGDSSVPSTPAEKPAPSASAPAAKSSPSVPSSPGTTAGAGAARNPDGTFAPTAKPTDPKSAAASPPVSGTTPEFKIPDRWPDDVKATLTEMHAVNPKYAQFVLDQYAHFRRVDSTREGQAKAEVAAKLKPFDDLLGPGREKRALQNVDDTTYVRNLIAAGEVLDKKPIEGLRWLAQKYGVDLAQLADPQYRPQAPQVAPEVQELRQKTAQIEQFISQQHRQAEDQQLRAAGDWINQFASQKDAQGQPAYPHFDDVLPEIIVNVQYQRDSGQEVNIHAAYERAVRMNDTVWLKEQAARTKAEEDSAKARRLREIEDAKRAGFSVSGSGGASSAQPADSLRGELERLLDK